MAERLAGRVAVVTGGASGIGLGIARRFLAEGARVVIGDRNGEALAGVAAELGPSCATVAMDVTVEADVERLMDRALETFGGLDIAVNNAGLGALARIVDLDEARWDRVLDVCLKGVFLCIKHAGRRMIAAGTRGVMINIASINARQPAEGFAAYCSAKAGVEMLTRVAAMELGPHGIRVAAIGPGLIDTPATRFAQENPAVRAAYLENIPLGRAGTTNDIANAAVFLASDEASWITGTTLFVDGAELTKKYPDLFALFGRA